MTQQIDPAVALALVVLKSEGLTTGRPQFDGERLAVGAEIVEIGGHRRAVGGTSVTRSMALRGALTAEDLAALTPQVRAAALAAREAAQCAARWGVEPPAPVYRATAKAAVAVVDDAVRAAYPGALTF